MTWEKFKLVDSAFENPKSFRLSYHEGVFELVPTSREHEILSGIIAFALNFYLGLAEKSGKGGWL
jgi:Uma2 family endonuclease